MGNKKKKLLSLENIARDIANFYEGTARDNLHVKEYKESSEYGDQERFIVQIPLDRDGEKRITVHGSLNTDSLYDIYFPNQPGQPELLEEAKQFVDSLSEMILEAYRIGKQMK